MTGSFGTLETLTFRTFFLILFGLFAVYGAVSTTLALRRMRARRNYQGALLAWTVPPTSGLGLSQAWIEGGAWVGVGIHALTLVAVGLAEALVLAYRPMRPLLSWGLSGILVVPAVVMGISMVGICLGMALFRPLAELLGGERHFAVSAEGILYIGQLNPWSAFRSYSLAAQGSVVQFWSASFPGLITILLTPPPEKMPELLALLQNKLPGKSSKDSGGFLAQAAFPALMAGLAAPIVLAAGLLFLAPAEAALVANGVLAYLLLLIGGKGFIQLGFGGNSRPAPLEQDSTPGSNGTGATSG